MIKFRWEAELKETPIGKIPRNWEIREVQNVSTVNPENISKEDSFRFIEYIDINSVEEGTIKETKKLELKSAPSRAKRKVKPNDIIISTVRPRLKHFAFIKKANPNTIVSTGFAVVRAVSINPKYLYYYLITDNVTEYLSQIAEEQASTYPAFTPDVLKNLKTPYPSLEEQKRMGTVLSWFDDLIENKRRQNEILEKVAMAIFKSWFIDFEPFQDEEFVYSEELDMEIPKGWEVKPIGEVAEIMNGFSYKSNEKLEKPTNSAHVFITLKNTVEGGGFNPEYAWVKSDRLKERHFVYESDLILPSTEQTKDARLLGSPGIVILPPRYERGVYSMDIAKVSPIMKEFKYYLYFNFKFNREHVATFHSGTSILHFKIQNFKENYYIPVPPKPILERFHSLVEPLFRKIIINEKEIMVLKKARDTLLPQLVFGRLRVVEL